LGQVQQRGSIDLNEIINYRSAIEVDLALEMLTSIEKYFSFCSNYNKLNLQLFRDPDRFSSLNSMSVSVPVSASDRFDWLFRGVSEIFPHHPNSTDPTENLVQRLDRTARPLRIKFGIDPTGVEIHLGHSIPLRKLRSFQDAGHTAVLIIGDFTARIGDPTGKSEVRQQLTPEQVTANAQSYLDLVRPILDFDTPGRLEVRYNSEWLSELDLGQTLELLSTMTVGQMLAKEGFALRYERETPIFIHEFLYPLMQGYESSGGTSSDISGKRHNLAC
jgi:tyrosyl-tRNA synthetase